MSRRPPIGRRPALHRGLVGLAIAAMTLPLAAHPARLDPGAIAWRELHLSAKKLFVTATTRVELRQAGAQEVRRELSQIELAGGLEPRSAVYAVEIDVTIAGRRSSDLVLFEPNDAAALLRRKESFGKDPYDKIYRHGRSGVALRRRAPAIAAEQKLAAERWSQIERFHYPHPDGIARTCPVVSEPSALLYVVSALRLERGEEAELCVFTGKRLHRVLIQGGGLESLPGSYVEVAAGGRTVERSGPFQVRRLIVRPRPIEPGGSTEEFELLGLAGDVELLVERESRVPLLIAGRLSHLGPVEVRLDRVVLR